METDAEVVAEAGLVCHRPALRDTGMLCGDGSFIDTPTGNA